MNKQIFKKCKILGKYSNEGMMYGQIRNEREKLGGNKKIHMNEKNY